jgi:hypothetical protein
MKKIYYAHLHDEVYAFSQPGWEIVATGAINKNGYPLDILIKKGNETRQVNPFDEQLVHIFPPEKEIKAFKSDIEGLENYPGLRIIRSHGKKDYYEYDLVCTSCYKTLTSTTTFVEYKKLFIEPNCEEIIMAEYEAFDSDVINSSILCGCEEKTYDKLSLNF